VIANRPAPDPAVDWDDAYANTPYIPQGSTYPARWIERATAFREALTAAGKARTDLAYGPAPRNRLDLFLPDADCKGLVVFVHGGFWKAFDKSSWSHLAKGSIESGYAVAMPSYSLCPEARISGITREIAGAIDHAAMQVPGDILLCGHSAGGHLVTRMVCQASPLGAATALRIARTVSISGLHDLQPLLRSGGKRPLVCLESHRAFYGDSGVRWLQTLFDQSGYRLRRVNEHFVCTPEQAPQGPPVALFA